MLNSLPGRWTDIILSFLRLHPSTKKGTNWEIRIDLFDLFAVQGILILGISELKWTGMGEFNSDHHYIYYCGKEPLRRNGVALIVNKRVQNAVPRCSLKNDRMVSIRFRGKSFNITVIQVCAPTTDSEEAGLNGSVKTYKTSCCCC